MLLLASLLSDLLLAANVTVRVAPCSYPMSSNQTWKINTIQNTIVTAPYEGTAKCLSIDVPNGGVGAKGCAKDAGFEADIIE